MGSGRGEGDIWTCSGAESLRPDYLLEIEWSLVAQRYHTGMTDMHFLALTIYGKRG